MSQLIELLCALPRHNASKEAAIEAIAKVAAKYSVTELREARQSLIDGLARDRGVEFDDQRSRYKTQADIESICRALGLLGEKDAFVLPKAKGEIEWKKVPQDAPNAPQLVAEVNGKVYEAFAIRRSFPYPSSWEVRYGGQVVSHRQGGELPTLESDFA